MPVRYLLKSLLLPPGVLLLLVLVAWWLRRTRPRLAVLCMVLGVGGLWLMSLPATTRWAGDIIEQIPPLAPERWSVLASQADVIVVLGAGRERNDPTWLADAPTGTALERMRYAARLAKASGIPLLTSGGFHYGKPPSEAAIMAQSLDTDFGTPVRWQEGESRTTWENAELTARILLPLGLKRVVLVTQGWHMPRALWSFERAGFAVVAAPVGFLGVDRETPLDGWAPDARAFAQNGQLLNEAAGLLVYPLLYR